jgi:hypothetical protein
MVVDEATLRYLAGQAPFLDERDTMTTTTPPATVPEKTYYYLFDLRQLPSAPLERISPLSHVQMEVDPVSYFAFYGYSLLSSPNEHLTYYHSDRADAEYLAFVRVSDATGAYRLVFHIRSDQDWTEWKRIYEPYLHRILTMPGVLPEVPSDPLKAHEIIHLDPRKVAGMGGRY